MKKYFARTLKTILILSPFILLSSNAFAAGTTGFQLGQTVRDIWTNGYGEAISIAMTAFTAFLIFKQQAIPAIAAGVGSSVFMGVPAMVSPAAFSLSLLG